MRLIKAIVGVVIAVLVVGTILVPVTSKYNSDGENTLDIVVLGGQSNMAYIPSYMDLTTVNEEIPQPETNCYFYGYADRPAWNNGDSSQYDIHSMTSDGAWIIGGEEASVAKTISSYTNDDVLVVNVAIPAYSISQFEPGTTGGNHIQNVLTGVMSKIPSKYTQVKCGWAWCQGESDKTTAVDDYVASFERVQSIFEGFGFNECYLVQTKPADSGNATAAQAQIVNTVPEVTLASTAPSTFTVANGLLIEGNSLHYSQAGRDIVGTDIGEAICKNLTPHLRSSEVYGVISMIPILITASLIIAVAGLIVSRRIE